MGGWHYFFQTDYFTLFTVTKMSSYSSSSEFPDQAFFSLESPFIDGLSMGDSTSIGGESDSLDWSLGNGLVDIPFPNDPINEIPFPSGLINEIPFPNDPINEIPFPNGPINEISLPPLLPLTPCDEMSGMPIHLDNDMPLLSSFGTNAEHQYQGEEVDSMSSDQAGEVLMELCDTQATSECESIVQELNNQLKSSRHAKHTWTKAEDDLLREVVMRVESESSGSKRIWTRVMKEFNRQSGLSMSGKQCREHYTRLTKTYLTGAWTEDEKAYVQQYINGDLTMEELCMCVRRNKKQISERIAIETKNKAPWSKEEIEELKRLIGMLGRDYAEIYHRMKHFYRTYQQIRSKVNALLKK